jgi:hypothetical protein
VTLKAKGELAWKLWYLGRHEEAVEKLKHLMVVYRRDFGWDDVDTLDLAEKLLKAYVFRNKEERPCVRGRQCSVSHDERNTCFHVPREMRLC